MIIASALRCHVDSVTTAAIKRRKGLVAKKALDMTVAPPRRGRFDVGARLADAIL